jgi:hypothetical protein
MPKSRFELRTELPATVTRPLYAGVGVTDLAVEFVREYVADMQKRAGEMQKEVQKTVSGLDYQPSALATEAQKRAHHATKLVTERVETLNKTVADDAQARRALIEKRVAEIQAEAKALPTRLQKFLDEQLGTAGDTYGELVTRGESLVDRIRRQQSTQDAEKAVKTTVAKAKTTKTQATKSAAAAKKSAKKSAATTRKSPAKGSAKATVTSAKKAAESTADAVVDAAEKIGD